MAWPSIRDNFDLPLSALGLLLGVYTAAYMVAGTATGPLLRRFGTGALLAIGFLVGAAGLAGAALAPGWVALLVAIGPIGFCGGLLDAALNAHVALTADSRALGLLHGAYGVGATVGPLVFTAILVAGGSWRWGYALVIGVDLALAAWFWRLRVAWDDRVAPADRGARPRRRLFDGVVVLSLLLFFVYAGVEVSGGQWAFSVLTESRGMGTGEAGLWVTAYWGALAAGRIAVGVGLVRLSEERLLAASGVLMLAGVALFWWDRAPVIAAAGLPVAGLGMASIFPTLVGLTPRRVGADRAGAVIGLEVAVGALAGGTLPGAVGLLLDERGLEALGPTLVAGAALVLVLERVLARRVSTDSPRR